MKIAKTLLAATALIVCAAPAAMADELTKAEVEKIIHEYIMSHPTDILDSVQQYQEKSMREKSQDAVKNNKDDLYDTASPIAGNPKGDVTLVEFFDYNCGYCKKVTPDLDKLIEQDKNLRVMFKEFPILSPTSEMAAKWALAAHKQDKYYAFHEALMKNRTPLDEAVLEKIAKETGLDVEKLKKDAEGTDIMMQIEQNKSLAGNMDIRGTPAFVIGDEMAPGAIGLSEMKRMIEKARAKKN
jgi:protein-disulfide isomerase